MKQFVYKIVLYSVIFLFTINLFSFLGRESLKRSSFFKPSFLANSFNPEEKFDYFILGSSRGLTTLNSNTIDQRLKFFGVNLSMDDTDLKTHLLMLKHFYNLGFQSDYCILTLDHYNFASNMSQLANNDHRFSQFISEKIVREHFRKYEQTTLKPIYNSLFLPFLSYSYYNLQLLPASAIAMIKPNKRHLFDENGNYTYPDFGGTNSKNVESTKEESQITNCLVEEIRSICEQNGTELIVYIAPYRDISFELYDSKNLINHSGYITDDGLFYDDKHVNKSGREYATIGFIRDFKIYRLKQKNKPLK